jgi:hypothetical protein
VIVGTRSAGDAKQNTRLTAQPAKRVTASQSMCSSIGFGGRSGLMNRRTNGIANSAKGMLIQKIHRHENASFTRAVTSGVVGRVA